MPTATRSRSTPNSPAAAARRLALAAAGTLPLVPLSVVFADRWVSEAAHAAFHGVAAFVWLTWIVVPVAPVSALMLLGTGIAALLGRPPGDKARVAIACALAALAAGAIKDQLKLAFGRTWPETWTHNNPSWIDNQIFGFFPFHGGEGWASFPSGHTTVIAAPMAVLWCVAPRFRPLYPMPVILVAIGLIGADYHFLGDIIAGGCLGTACGAGMAALVGRTQSAATVDGPQMTQMDADR